MKVDENNASLLLFFQLLEFISKFCNVVAYQTFTKYFGIFVLWKTE